FIKERNDSFYIQFFLETRKNCVTLTSYLNSYEKWFFMASLRSFSISGVIPADGRYIMISRGFLRENSSTAL
ncbi:hypothetical protein, partial [Methanosarcina mazei]|uniref:hypothetical protein n=1 Tax=Methanosarcina mazei TaxID=2209 RepID=UPI001F445B0C